MTDQPFLKYIIKQQTLFFFLKGWVEAVNSYQTTSCTNSQVHPIQTEILLYQIDTIKKILTIGKIHESGATNRFEHKKL